MAERIRFSEEELALRRHLVEFAREDAPPPHAVDRTLAKIAALTSSTVVGLGAAGAAASGAAKTSTALTSALVAKWFVVGAAAAALTAGVAAKVSTPPPREEAASAPASSSIPARRSIAEWIAPSPTSTDPPEPEPPVMGPSGPAPSGLEWVDPGETAGLRSALPSPPGEAPTSAKPSASSGALELATQNRALGSPGSLAPAVIDSPSLAPTRSHAPAHGASTLARELSLLDEARTWMVHGRPAKALAVLNRYETEFPAGSMSSEAAAVRVEAMVRSGRLEEARELGAAFLSRYPRSPLADRVRSALNP